MHDWDWWGPLLLCLALSARLSISAPKDGFNPLIIQDQPFFPLHSLLLELVLRW
jgi:hypothetical protein